MMSLFRKHWTAGDADEWTVHDLLAGILAVVSYVLVGIGTMGVLLLQIWGFIVIAIGIISIVLMYFIIDPKLRAMSKAFSEQQQKYLEYIDKSIRWED